MSASAADLLVRCVLRYAGKRYKARHTLDLPFLGADSPDFRDGTWRVPSILSRPAPRNGRIHTLVCETPFADKGVWRHSRCSGGGAVFSASGLSTGYAGMPRIGFLKNLPDGLATLPESGRIWCNECRGIPDKAEKPCIGRACWPDRSTIFSITLSMLNRRCLTSA